MGRTPGATEWLRIRREWLLAETALMELDMRRLVNVLAARRINREARPCR